jgi:hypothetical protein
VTFNYIHSFVVYCSDVVVCVIDVVLVLMLVWIQLAGSGSGSPVMMMNAGGFMGQHRAQSHSPQLLAQQQQQPSLSLRPATAASAYNDDDDDSGSSADDMTILVSLMFFCDEFHFFVLYVSMMSSFSGLFIFNRCSNILKTNVVLSTDGRLWPARHGGWDEHAQSRLG